VVEGISHDEHNIHGIMWHPERNLPYLQEDLIWVRQLFQGGNRN